MKKRDKASDVFAKGNPLFARKVPFAETFPMIAAITIEVKYDGRGAFNILGDLWRFDASNLSEFIDCRDPRCYRGGFSIRAVILDVANNRLTNREGWSPCQGTEGGSARKRGPPCISTFDYRIDIVYK
jgi:hypothetical protein